MVEHALVILRRDQRQNVLSVREYHERSFFAHEEFFNDDFLAGLTEGFPDQDLVNGGLGFLASRTDEDSFAAGETVGFHDVRGGILGNVPLRRCGLCKRAERGGRYIVLSQDLFSKGFTAF